LSLFSFVRTGGPVAETSFHRIHKFNVPLVPRPSNRGGSQAASPQRLAVSLLLCEPILLVLNDPALLPLGMERARAFGFQRTSNQIDDKSIQRILNGS
jgi:hypothetical protein